MKKYFFAMLTMAAALCGCSEDELLTNEVPQTGGGETNEVVEPMVFTATMEGAPETRATYDGTHKCASWQVDDHISVNGYEYQANTAGTSTTFTATGGCMTKEMRPTYVSSTNTHSYNDSNPASYLVDGRGTDTRWCVSTDQKVDGVWNIVVSTGEATLLRSIKLWNAESGSGSYQDRIWKEIKVYGSQSSTSGWEEIKSFDDLNLQAGNYNLAGEIVIDATKEYTFYRIDVLNNKGNGYMQMSDMKFVLAHTFASPYKAFFPANLYDGEKTVLPATITETWAEGKFNMPMYAESNTTDLQFKNLCGVLKITVNREQIKFVKGIKVSSQYQATSGAFTVINNTAVLKDPSAANFVRVTYTYPVEIAEEGTSFYVAIPAQTYRNLWIELSQDGTIYKYGIVTKDRTDIEVQRNKIYQITKMDKKMTEDYIITPVDVTGDDFEQTF